MGKERERMSWGKWNRSGVQKRVLQWMGNRGRMGVRLRERRRGMPFRL